MSRRALTESALDAVERLADQITHGAPTSTDAGTATTSDGELPDAAGSADTRLAVDACLSATRALLTIVHALVDELPGLSAAAHARCRHGLADDAKKAGRLAYRASLALSAPNA